MLSLENYLANYYEGYSCTLFPRGGTGLYALFRMLREQRGVGEIIIPGICCEIVPLAAIYAGMKPIIVDVDRKTLCISPESVEQKITKNTVAIVLVYIFGNIIDHAPFDKLKSKYNLIIVEDLAQAIGGRYDDGQQLGQRFDFTLLSFADDKIVSGDGGAIIQHDGLYGNELQRLSQSLPVSPDQRVIHQKALSLRNLIHALRDLSRVDPSVNISSVFSEILPYYKDLIVRRGENIDRVSIYHQLQNISREQEVRYSKYLYYKEHIRHELFEVIEMPAGSMCWRAPILINDPVQAFHVTKLLRRNNIPASNHYFPLDKMIYNHMSINNAHIGSRIINLWVDSSIDMQQMIKTVDLLNSYDEVKESLRLAE